MRLVTVLISLLALTEMHGTASAASYNLGVLPSTYAEPIIGVTLGSPGSAHVVDSYEFTVPTTSALLAGAFDIAIWPVANFSNLTAELKDSACGYCIVAAAGSSVGFLLSYSNLVSTSTYRLQIAGIIGSHSIAGIYVGFLAVTPVPIPPALLLFASALFGTAAFARRRGSEQGRGRLGR